MGTWRYFRLRPLATRKERLLRLGMHVQMAIAGVVIVAAVASGQRRYHAAGVVTSAVLMLGLAPWRFAQHRAFRDGFLMLRARQFHVCPACGYDLRGIDSPCPECGAPFDAASLEYSWRGHYRAHMLRPGGRFDPLVEE